MSMSEKPDDSRKPVEEQTDDGPLEGVISRRPKSRANVGACTATRVFMSDKIWFQRVINSKDDISGFWLCPTNNCDGKGFTFDIFPTDPDHPANAGWTYFDDDDEPEEFEEEEFCDVPKEEWDPSEVEYKGEDDIEGEEWKFGMEAGADAPEELWSEHRRRWEEEQRKYDAPDERPREEDWSDRPGRPRSDFRDEDIPF